MGQKDNALYREYGAHELKAKYQRNLLLGMALATLLAIAAGSAAWVIPAPEKPVGPIGSNKDRVMIVVDIPTQQTIVRDEPQIAGGKAPPVDAVEGIPEPVPDNSIIEDDVTIVTPHELVALRDGNGLPPIGEGTGSAMGVADGTDLLPAIDSFVKVDVLPEMVYECAPEYPRFAEKAGLEGKVYVKVLVDRDGSIRDVRLLKSSATDSLDEAALAAAWKCKFKPAVRASEPVASWVSYSIRFLID